MFIVLVPLQALEDRHLADIIKTTAEFTYNLPEGPLWRARMVICPSDEPCNLPQVKDTFPHQYHFAFEFHHAINDGFSVSIIMKTFFTILDNLLDGAQSDDKQVGELHDGWEIRAAEDKIRETLEKDPQRLKVLLEERYKLKNRVSLITEAFGEPQEPSPTTYILDPQVLDDKILQVFNAKCKAHKVTFNSGISAVFNVALVEMVRETGVMRDSYLVSTRHPVDTRRYMSDRKAIVLGYHGMPMTQIMMTPWNTKNSFWKYVIDFDNKFRGRINKMGPLEERVLDTMMQTVTSDHNHKVISDCLITNIYFPRIKPYGNGKHIQLTDSQSLTNLNKNDYGIGFGVSMFRGQVQIQFALSLEYITTENCLKLSNKMMNVFNDIANMTD